MLSDRKIEIPIKHLNNSAGIMNFDEYFDMCRMGIITYGLYPSEEVDKSLLDIEPIMSWYTKISHIKKSQQFLSAMPMLSLAAFLTKARLLLMANMQKFSAEFVWTNLWWMAAILIVI